ncbi:glycyl-radical enzyme activating protein [Bacillus marasmi]|uniref:glycyl-radical enzyme activating protein n=1 Tax=Bacillus marasmi TaxID=1926279 RepID=UPI00164D2E9F|nr:glycyl-radical enzyme activating protein [Bacillus marasmi]
METSVPTKGIVFDIQRFSVHDGPGIRSLVFLKGCPLRCRWCSNPESQKKDKQIMFIDKNCIHCGKCVEVCPQNAISFNPTFSIDTSKCDLCGKCVDICYSKALNMTGELHSVAEVIKVLKKDNIHYRRSGGGITLSGGEPLFQSEFAKELLKECKAQGWHTAIETTAYTSKQTLAEVLPWLDLVLLDIKHTNKEKHVEYTGKSNERILENARFIGEFGVPIIIRVPVIPGFNNEISEIEEISRFAKSINGVKEVHLLPYHRLGENKYNYLEYEYRLKGIEPPEREDMRILKETVEKIGMQCKIGG